MSKKVFLIEAPADKSTAFIALIPLVMIKQEASEITKRVPGTTGHSKLPVDTIAYNIGCLERYVGFTGVPLNLLTIASTDIRIREKDHAKLSGSHNRKRSRSFEGLSFLKMKNPATKNENNERPVLFWQHQTPVTKRVRPNTKK
jgi:hypothetical protein